MQLARWTLMAPVLETYPKTSSPGMGEQHVAYSTAIPFCASPSMMSVGDPCSRATSVKPSAICSTSSRAGLADASSGSGVLRLRSWSTNSAASYSPAPTS